MTEKSHNTILAAAHASTLPDGPGEHRQHVVRDRRHGRGAEATQTLGDKVKASLAVDDGSSALPGAPTPQIFLTVIVDSVTGKLRLSGNAPTAVAVLAMLNSASQQVLEQIMVSGEASTLAAK